MSNVINFDFESNVVRTVEIDEEHHFVLKDVLTAMKSASRPANVKTSLQDTLGRQSVLSGEITDRMGRSQKVSVVPKQSVLYIITQSKSKSSASAKIKLLSKITESSEIIAALNSFEVPEDIPNMYVYAIREKETRRIKFGISRNPQERLKQLQTGNSQELELVATKKTVNGFEDERLLHKANNQHAIRGEWFNEDVDTQDLVAVQ